MSVSARGRDCVCVRSHLEYSPLWVCYNTTLLSAYFFLFVPAKENLPWRFIQLEYVKYKSENNMGIDLACLICF